MNTEALTVAQRPYVLPLTISREAKRFIRGRRLILVQRLEDIVNSTATEERVGVAAIEVEYSDLMKEMGQPFLTLVVRTGSDVSPDRALEYWATVGDKIDQSTPDLSIDKMFASNVTVSVEWVEPDAA